MRRASIIVASALFFGVGVANVATTATTTTTVTAPRLTVAKPKLPVLHRFQTGKRIRGLQWLLSGRRPSKFKIQAYRYRINGIYDLRTSRSVRNMKWRLGWPGYNLNGDVAGSFFQSVLLGKVARPKAYYLRVTKRLAALKRIQEEKARTACARLIIATMRNEVGVHEIPYGSNSGLFIGEPPAPPHGVRNYQAVTGAYHAPWCVSFAQWVWAKARVHSPRAWHGVIANNSAGAFYVAGWARLHGWARSVPKPAFGVVFLDRLGHMGIVESVSSSGFTSIEGNASNSVLRRFHPFGGRPEIFIAVPGCDTG